MAKQTELRFTEPGMRLLENEHRYLSFLMDEWHAIVLEFENDQISLEEGREKLKMLRQKLYEFVEPLKNHTDKEEEHFFPVLGTYIGFEQGPLMGIQEEHQEIDGYIGHFFHHTRGNIDLMSIDDMKTVAKDAGEAFEVLTIHFVKEETVLFPMAEKLMKAADQDALYEKMNTLIT
ncbi:cation-binding protein [Planococcus glaciei]|uniref:Hemerythrin domain-containing protein n=1 Tax=Planococcus glaciei TaxID=459472 RepID=A0A7H8QDF5_9BACL|nr:hemerythrin domain-containing protein [Planococcus glaciei]MCP2034702.1 hemerythrin-like domain-containing protein [Planomicrobium sp. HSC-17F08]ETP68163.1 cation-binding protein [Planococcus glaciei CHR43]KOF08929.1 cation-binding protein [Planococcus glaciei]MBX0315963.1 hemerythrin domain-containing protein [Planococcus glaciei]QKX52044.1 hemerythrin domain-containing protein [Planococcus glaciei]